MAASMACAHVTARRADANASMNPSPWLLTTLPPCSAVTFLTASLCARSTSSQRRSPRNPFNRIESSMSVNAIVTVPSGEEVADRSGRDSLTASTMSSTDVVSKKP